MTPEESREMMRTLGRIEANQQNTFNLLANQKDRLDHHGDRLSKLERKWAWAFGWAAAAGFLAQIIPHPFK